MGADEEYNEVPWFWSDQYNLKLQIAGLSEGFDDYVLRGNPDDNSFSCAYLRDGRLIAIDSVNAPKDFMLSKPLIKDACQVNPAMLADTSLTMRELRQD